MTVARPVGAKLYLEGIEVPIIGATITASVNTATIAYIDIVPHKDINNIKPRTHVLVTVRDTSNPAADYPYVTAFEGEVFGYSFGRTTQSRSFTLQCIDLSSYWDNVLIYFVNAMVSLSKGGEVVSAVGQETKNNAMAGINTVAVTHSNASFIKKIMQETLAKPGKDFLDAFVAVYENISSINKFYKNAEARLKIKDRIVLKSSQKLTELLQGKETIDWMEGIITQNTGYHTLRSIMQDLMSIIFHDFVSAPFPSGSPSKVNSFIFKPNLYMVPPPACNIFFPDEYSSFQFSRNFFQEPTRMHYKPELPRAFAANVSMPMVYQPDEYANFMFKTYPAKSSPDALGTDGEQGHFKDALPDGQIADTKKEYDFLCNEEKYKGILLANESMMPATTQFAASTQQTGNDEFASKVAKYLFYKKRYQERSLQISGHLKLSVVPGFPVLILDDSEADQNVLAYCSSVTHRIYATDGGYTTVALSYARLVDERDVSSGRGIEPVIPPWFDAAVFGKMTSGASSSAAKSEVAERGVQYVASKGLSSFYSSLLGPKGSTALTSMYSGESTIVGATRALTRSYIAARKNGSEALQDFIAKTTARDYVRAKSNFAFLGASSVSKAASFDEFVGGAFSGASLDVKKDVSFVETNAAAQLDKNKENKSSVMSQQQDKINNIRKYRNSLKTARGFKG